MSGTSPRTAPFGRSKDAWTQFALLTADAGTLALFAMAASFFLPLQTLRAAPARMLDRVRRWLIASP